MEITNNRYFRVKQDKNTGNLYSVFVLPVNLDAIGTLVLDSKKCKKKRLKSVFEIVLLVLCIYILFKALYCLFLHFFLVSAIAEFIGEAA